MPRLLRATHLVLLALLLARPGGAEAVPEAEARPAAPGGHGLSFVEIRTGPAPPPGAGARPLPLVVAIHGLGDWPESFADLLDGFHVPARVVLPRAPRPWGSGFAWLPGRNSPARGRAERRSTERLAGLLRELTPEGTEGAVVTGFSQGGILSFALAARHPELVRAAVPVSGYLPTSITPRRRAGPLPPIRALHGTADRVLTVSRARRGAARLRRLGFDVELQEYEGVGHTVTDQMREDLFERLAAALRAR